MKDKEITIKELRKFVDWMNSNMSETEWEIKLQLPNIYVDEVNENTILPSEAKYSIDDPILIKIYKK